MMMSNDSSDHSYNEKCNLKSDENVRDIISSHNNFIAAE